MISSIRSCVLITMILNSLIIFGCSQENDTEKKFLVTNA
jgi:hypothetical protein